MNVAPEKERKKKELADFRQIDIVKGTSHYALCEEQCLTPFGLLQKKKKSHAPGGLTNPHYSSLLWQMGNSRLRCR